MMELFHRETVYLCYYFSLQLFQMFHYWVQRCVLESALSLFAKEHIHGLFSSLRGKRLGVLGIFAASALGIASPLCMYRTIPLSASFSESGMEDDWLAAFMMSSILLNPQLSLYSMALERTALFLRILFSFLCAAGLIRWVYQEKGFFNFTGFFAPDSWDTDPNLLMRFRKNLGRNIKATGPIFLLCGSVRPVSEGFGVRTGTARLWSTASNRETVCTRWNTRRRSDWEAASINW